MDGVIFFTVTSGYVSLNANFSFGRCIVHSFVYKNNSLPENEL